MIDDAGAGKSGAPYSALISSGTFSRPGSSSLLEVRDLKVQFVTRNQHHFAVCGLSFDVPRGRTLAIVGESGSGKSVSCRALMALLPKSAIVTGSIRLFGKELLGLPENEMRRHRGADISIIFQDADRALNPTMQVGAQISEAVRVHERVGRRAARDQTLELLHLLRFRSPRREYAAYPHQLSGGMRQRILIAMAVALRPSVLIADEPTRSLDFSTQTAIMALLGDLQRQLNMALILISHDLRLVTSFAHSVMVMRAGRLIEHGPANRLVTHPRAGYTRELLAAIPRRPTAGSPNDEVKADDEPGNDSRTSGPKPVLLRAHKLVQEFVSNGGVVRALADVSLEIRSGETLGVIGETGSGKSSLARALLQAPKPTSGRVSFRGCDLTRLRGAQLYETRRHMQMIFQDPFGSVDPKWNVSDIVEEPLAAHRWGHELQRRRKVRELLKLVGLSPDSYGLRHPRHLSGGECQRVAIARALALEPQLVICDEALSSLDVIVQSQIIELFKQLREQMGLAYLFVSHDLLVVQHLSHRVAVMYRGHLIEIGRTASVYRAPMHPYSVELLTPPSGLTATSQLRQRLRVHAREDDPAENGCRFRADCARAQPRCVAEVPALRPVRNDHLVACHYPVAGADNE